MDVEVTRDVEVVGDAMAAMDALARNALPDEACAILLGTSGELAGDGAVRIEQIVPAANVHASPCTHFEIDPQALINAYRDGRSGGPAVLGYFHSHPNGPARPSATDAEMAARDGKIWAIWGSGADGNSDHNRDIRVFRSGEEGFEALSLRVIES